MSTDNLNLVYAATSLPPHHAVAQHSRWHLWLTGQLSDSLNLASPSGLYGRRGVKYSALRHYADL